MFFRRTERRGFLTGLGALIAGSAAAHQAGAESIDHQDESPQDKWLDALTGKHRQLFDFNAHGDGISLIHMHNFVETHKSAYGAAEKELNVIGTFYGGSTPLAWNDKMWAKYKVGQALNITDPSTKAPLVRNWFNQPQSGDPVFLNGMLAVASIESLQKKGATFIMCNNAFRLWVGRLAGMGLGTAAEIEPDLRANLLPGVITVPAMVIAINRAQRRGITYMRM